MMICAIIRSNRQLFYFYISVICKEVTDYEGIQKEMVQTGDDHGTEHIFGNSRCTARLCYV